MVYSIDGEQFTRRKKVILTGAASGAQTDYQIKLSAVWADAMQADWDDTRFTKADMQTLIDAWLEVKVDSTSADIWAEFLTTPADGVEKTKGYMYYGNAGASNYWDIGATFLFGDDFPGASLDTDKWDGDTGSVSVSGGIATLTGQAKRLHGKLNQSIPYIAESRWKLGDKTVANQQGGIAPHPDNEEPGIYYYTHTNVGNLYANQVLKESDTETDLGVYETRKFVFASTSDVKVYYNDTLELAITSDISNVAMNNYYRSITGSDVLVDWAFARKYAANPPTAAFGTEEHQRRTPMMM